MDLILPLLSSLGEFNNFTKFIIIVLSTFILEDPVSLFCGILVENGKLSWSLAYISLCTGIYLGDVGLYSIGSSINSKFFQKFSIFRKTSLYVNKRKLSPMVIFFSRFIPGTRFLTFVIAGAQKTISPKKFSMFIIITTLIWTYLLLRFGGLLINWTKSTKGILSILLLFVICFFLERFVSKKWSAYVSGAMSLAELIPTKIFYIPCVFYWIYLGIQKKSLSIFTLANPDLYLGGFIGESKEEIYALIKNKKDPFWLKQLTVTKEMDKEKLSKLINQEKLVFPVYFKPDVGERGNGVKLAKDFNQLMSFLNYSKNTSTKFIIQEKCNFKYEAGVFFYKYPETNKVVVDSITIKEIPYVIGDGLNTLTQLIKLDKRASYFYSIYQKNFAKNELENIVPIGDKVFLTNVGNHCKGAIFKDGNHLITKELKESISVMTSKIPNFYYGRFDLKFNDFDNLKNGENLKVIEVNGVTSEMTHIWDKKYKLLSVYKVLFNQYRVLFDIAEQNHKRGFKTNSLFKVIKELIKSM